jgi:hypothetical protein
VVDGLEVYLIDQFYDSLHRPDLVREKLSGDPAGKVREAAARLDLTKAVGSELLPALPSPRRPVAPPSGPTGSRSIR